MADITKEKMKASIKKDIEGVQDTADLLSGKKPIQLRGVSSTKKTETNKPTNLPKFLKFMEEQYKGSNLKIELKKKI